MSDRLAFAPLKSLETALDLSVQQRARALFETAKAKTARGSGHELDKHIAGNSTAIASAKTELEGESAEDLDVHQRHAMVTKPQFRLLVSSLQTVLELRSSAKTAFTPTRGWPKHLNSILRGLMAASSGSARKRKAETQAAPDEPVTPSKSAARQQATSLVTPSEDRPSTPTRSTARRSARSTASLRDLATASHQKARRAADEDLSVEVSAARSSRGSPRKAASSSGATKEAVNTDTPSKASTKGKQKATEAFEKAMVQKTPIKGKNVLQATPTKSTVDYSKPFEAVKDDVYIANKQEAEEVPYETYWGDMFIRYRRKEDVDARRLKTEAWRQRMLQSLRSAA